MRTKIFAYKGAIGAETDLDNGIFENNPKAPGQIGVVISTKEIDITQEAIDTIKESPREGGSFSGIMLMKHGDTASIGLAGGWKHLFIDEGLAIGRDCDKEVLDVCTIIDIEVPEDFKEVINKHLES